MAGAARPTGQPQASQHPIPSGVPPTRISRRRVESGTWAWPSRCLPYSIFEEALVGRAILLLLLGVPIPVILLLALIWR